MQVDIPSLPLPAGDRYKFANPEKTAVIRASDGAVIPVGVATGDSRDFDKWRQFNIADEPDPAIKEIPLPKYPETVIDDLLGLLLAKGVILTSDLPARTLNVYLARTKGIASVSL